MRRRSLSPLVLVLAMLCAALAPAAALAQRGAASAPPSRPSAESAAPRPSPGPATPGPESPAPSPSRPRPRLEAELTAEPLPDASPFAWALPTSLRICMWSLCDLMAPWASDSLGIDIDSSEKSRTLEWSSPSSGATEVLWQVSSRPFDASFDPMPQGLVASGYAEGDEEGRFVLDFDHLVSTGDDAAILGGLHVTETAEATWTMADAWAYDGFHATGTAALAEDLLSHLPRVYYVRATPFRGGVRVGRPSNAIRVDVHDPESTNPLVIPELPESPYQVRIVEVEPIRPATMPAGCVYITAVDQAALRATYGRTVGDSMYRLYHPYLASHAPLCPSTDDGDGSFFEEFFDFVVTVASFPSAAYEEIKERLAETLALLWNETFGDLFDLECGEDCQHWLVVGMEAALTALGIPPELPNARELMEAGLDYLVAEAVERAGIDCDETCQDLVAEAIEEVAEQFANQTAHATNPALPQAVRAEPVPESMLRPAELLLEVWRDPFSPVDPAEQDAAVTVYFPGRNDAIVGETVWVSYDTCYYDYGSFPCDSRAYHVDEPLVAPVFRGIQVTIPDLAPGQGLLLPFSLQASEYWLPDHIEDIQAAGARPNWNDWPYLYEGAQVSVQAAVQCYAPVDTSWVPVWSVCGGSDSRTVIMPDHDGWYRP